jgi:hypothetical protein
MKTVLKQVVAALVAVKALFTEIGEAMEFHAAQIRGTAGPTRWVLLPMRGLAALTHRVDSGASGISVLEENRSLTESRPRPDRF